MFTVRLVTWRAPSMIPYPGRRGAGGDGDLDELGDAEVVEQVGVVRVLQEVSVRAGLRLGTAGWCSPRRQRHFESRIHEFKMASRDVASIIYSTYLSHVAAAVGQDAGPAR